MSNSTKAAPGTQNLNSISHEDIENAVVYPNVVQANQLKMIGHLLVDIRDELIKQNEEFEIEIEEC